MKRGEYSQTCHFSWFSGISCWAHKRHHHRHHHLNHNFNLARSSSSFTIITFSIITFIIIISSTITITVYLYRLTDICTLCLLTQPGGMRVALRINIHICITMSMCLVFSTFPKWINSQRDRCVHALKCQLMRHQAANALQQPTHGRRTKKPLQACYCSEMLFSCTEEAPAGMSLLRNAIC